MSEIERATILFLDTTILVDATLKHRERQERTLLAVRRSERSILPTYAMKEFRAGPLATYVWFHGVLRQSNTVIEALARAMRDAALSGAKDF